jgi:hypothetical protein
MDLDYLPLFPIGYLAGPVLARSRRGKGTLCMHAVTRIESIPSGLQPMALVQATSVLGNDRLLPVQMLHGSGAVADQGEAPLSDGVHELLAGAEPLLRDCGQRLDERWSE